MMTPNLILDMADLLAPFCSLAVGFALVGLGALVALGLDQELRRRRALPRVDLGVARAERPVRSADPTQAAA